MKKIPTDLSGRDVQLVLERVGFIFQGAEGDHMILRRADPAARVIVPDFPTLRVGTIRRIIADADLTAERFNELLRH